MSAQPDSTPDAMVAPVAPLPAPEPLVVVQAAPNWLDLGSLTMGWTVVLEDGSTRQIESPITITSAVTVVDGLELPAAVPAPVTALDHPHPPASGLTPDPGTTVTA